MRLGNVSDWVRSNPATRDFAIGYFGASTGAAAALVASVSRAEVKALVSRGGRPDLAWEQLPNVTAPTLLIVGGKDYPVIEMNRLALEQIRIPDKRMEIVPGATHLFEEPGALDEVAHLAAAWFNQYL
jgi:dienelactone hydrolase